MTTITVAQLLPVRHRCCGTPGSTALTSTQLDPPVRRAGPASQAPPPNGCSGPTPSPPNCYPLPAAETSARSPPQSITSRNPPTQSRT
ncbi:hypothetical protein [Corynebacterium matruchotii]